MKGSNPQPSRNEHHGLFFQNRHSPAKHLPQTQTSRQNSKGIKSFFPRSRTVENAPGSPAGRGANGNRSMISSMYESRRNQHHQHRPDVVAEAADEFVPNPKVQTPPASPSSAPKKKVWEHKMQNFLTRNKTDGTSSSPSSSATVSPTNVNSNSPRQQNSNSVSNLKRPFSLIPGTKRLLVRNSSPQLPKSTIDDLDVVKPRSNSSSSVSSLANRMNGAPEPAGGAQHEHGRPCRRVRGGTIGCHEIFSFDRSKALKIY